MRRIQLWSVQQQPGQQPQATPIDEVSATDTERLLEDLLVSAPKALLDGVSVIARQLPTAGGPLDLVGVDQSGRLVIFELKRGTLTRDAVAQVLDYASDLAQKDDDEFARLVEKHSGRGGTDRIDDFADWYGREYPNSDSILGEPPRMVLVGLGADERATRIVNFLAASGIDIKLLTFHAFRSDGRLFLARQVETVEPTGRSPSPSARHTKEENLRMLLELAERAGTKSLLLEIADFIQNRVQGYRYPGKSAFSFSLQERTEEGRPTLRSYFTLWADRGPAGTVVLTLSQRAETAAPEAVGEFIAQVKQARRTDSSWMPVEVTIAAEDWPGMSDALGKLLAGVVAGWRKREEAAEEGEESIGSAVADAAGSELTRAAGEAALIADDGAS